MTTPKPKVTSGPAQVDSAAPKYPSLHDARREGFFLAYLQHFGAFFSKSAKILGFR